MVRNCSRILLFGALMLLLSACSRQEDVRASVAGQRALNDLFSHSFRATGAVVRTERELTPEEKEVLEMEALIEDDKTGLALRHARNLMDSRRKGIRASVLASLQWIGRRAMPEITQMMNDDDEEIATEAMSAWEMAFDEIDGDHRKATVIGETVVVLKKGEHIEMVLSKLDDVEPRIVLPLLDRLAVENVGTSLGECAREKKIELENEMADERAVSRGASESKQGK